MPISIISLLKPKNNGQFPTHEDVDTLGGFQVRANPTDRDTIPTANRKAGMLVYSQSDATFYQLGSGLTNADWVVANLGGGGSGPLSGDVTGPSSGNTVVRLTTSSPLLITPSEFRWNSTTSTPLIDHAVLAGTGTNNGQSFTIKAQPGQQQTGAVNNNSGGNLVLSSGTAGTGGSGSAGADGSVVINTGTTAQITVNPSGTIITNNIALGGSLLRSVGNAPTEGYLTVNLPSDANLTLSSSQYNSSRLTFTSVSLTATRNIVLPLTAGASWSVINNTTGGQALLFIGSSGTGYAVINGGSATVWSDGTNIHGISGNHYPLTLSSSSASLIPGDWFCMAPGSSTQVIKATASNLATGGHLQGIALVAVAAGSSFTLYATSGDSVPPGLVSELGAGALNDVAVTAAARSVRVPFPDGSEVLGGIVDANGKLLVFPRASQGTSVVRKVNVRAFGAVGDGVTDDQPAFKAAQDYIIRMAGGTGPNFTGGTFPFGWEIDVPPGNYFFASDFEVSTPSIIRGFGTGIGLSRSIITLAPFTSWIVSGTPQKSLGNPQLASITGLDFFQQTSRLPKWQPGKAFAVGDKFACRAIDPVKTVASEGDKRLMLYFECIVAGNLSAVNANTTVASGSNGQNIASLSIDSGNPTRGPVLRVSTVNGMPTNGRATVVTSAGTAIVSFSGTDPVQNYLWNIQVITGSGTVSTGNAVTMLNTTIAAGSNGQVLPNINFTLHVLDTTGFPSRGCLVVQTTTGFVNIVYKSVGSMTTLLNCFCMSTGTLATGGTVCFEPDYSDIYSDPDFTYGTGNIGVYHWTPGSQIKNYTMVRASNGSGGLDNAHYNFLFHNSSGSSDEFTIAGPEPTWVFTDGATTTDSNLNVWVCHDMSNGSSLHDGTARFVSRIKPCVLMTTAIEIDHCAFTGGNEISTGINAGGVGVVAIGNIPSIPISDVSGLRINACAFFALDVGFAVFGGDAQGGFITNCEGFPGLSFFPSAWASMQPGEQLSGNGHPEQMFYPRYCYYDASFGGNTIANCHAELYSPGYAFLNDAGSGGRVGGYSESGGAVDVYRGSAFCIGSGGTGFDGVTPTPGSAGVQPIPFSSAGIQSGVIYNVKEFSNGRSSYQVGNQLMNPGHMGPGSLLLDVVTLDPFSDGNGTSSYTIQSDYNSPTGWISRSHGLGRASERVGLLASGSPGIKWFPSGFLLGDDPTQPQFGIFPSNDSWRARKINFGLRGVGSIFINPVIIAANTYMAQVVTTAGYPGEIWIVGLEVDRGNALFGGAFSPPSIVAPSDPTNTKRFVVTNTTLTGLTSAPEPNWSTAVLPGDTVTNGVDGIIYQLLATGAPVMAETWPLDTTTLAVTPQQDVKWTPTTHETADNHGDYVQTTNNTLTAVATFALTDQSVTSFAVEVNAFQSAGTGSPDGANFILRGAFLRNGGTVTNVKAPTVVDSNPNATGTAWSAVLAVSTTNVVVNVTGDTGKTINWSIVRQTIEART